jgi:hypothetical protein
MQNIYAEELQQEGFYNATFLCGWRWTMSGIEVKARMLSHLDK